MLQFDWLLLLIQSLFHLTAQLGGELTEKIRVDSSHGFSSVYFFDAPEVTQKVLSKVVPVGPY